MAKILDKDKKTVIVKFTIQEYKKLNETNSILFENDEEINGYEFVFDKPIKASDLLKSF
ncbi:MAG: hypothetical protein PHZ26_02140 [Candidatus Gracilibacteria bacterium]|nr:hypothetical protein [Candidatus Gracilibacteria bacterium]MDD2908535.1 hypothetical protein [Candidatus Gracilibacteria bacterium]